MNQELQNMADLLNRNGFDAQCCDTMKEATQLTLDMIPSNKKVGIGGSSTVKDSDIYMRMLERGNKVFWHWLTMPNKMDAERENAFHADWYISSTNALTEDGKFVNIDGTGNRVASMIFGPKDVLIIVGKNKLAGDLDDALSRIKQEACPKNAKRLKLETPCNGGVCTDCHSQDRMCNVTTILERPTNGRDVHVILVDEKLGF